MPYAWATTKRACLTRAVNRTIKLTNAEREAIRKLWNDGVAIREIARRYRNKCSRRLIQFIVHPERAERASFLFKLRALDGRYYKRERHRKYMKKYRRRKQKLINRMRQ